MKKQPERVTAFYYRTAQKKDTNPNLDNQMYLLNEYARQHNVNSYVMYVDNGYSGLDAGNRPAFSDLLLDMSTGQISKVVVQDTSRIARLAKTFYSFLKLADACSIEVDFLEDPEQISHQIDTFEVLLSAITDKRMV